MKNEKLKMKSEKFRIGEGRAFAYGEGGLRPKAKLSGTVAGSLQTESGTFGDGG